ncbi:hypothetical protein [Streptomyces noursei]|uniref:hypothetical protein n=1 Tax=Streptomyces noursei TaxID=1971 RepID=UPI0037F70EB9
MAASGDSLAKLPRRTLVYAQGKPAGLSAALSDLSKRAETLEYRLVGALSDESADIDALDIPLRKRRAGQQLAALVDLGAIDTLLVRSAHELARWAPDREALMGWLHKSGVDLLVVAPNPTEIAAWRDLWRSPSSSASATPAAVSQGARA